MDSKDIINNIRDFFRTADEKALAAVRAAASIKIEGDISIDEYLSAFSDEFFYTHDCESNCYVSDTIQIQTNVRQYQYNKEMGFESALLEYGNTELNITLNMESSHKGEVTKMIKKAA